MPVPSNITDLSVTAGSNSPTGNESIGTNLDDYLRAGFAFNRQLYNAITFHGQCRLTKSGANLLLSPYNGNKLIISGVQCSIPSAGVTLAPTSLAASTLYYIYAYMSGSTMTLEASTTIHATDSTTGVEIKSGDSTRTLVGMARTTSGTAWADSATQRFVRSWFNDRGVGLNNTFTAIRSTASLSAVEINSEIRCEFLLWANEVADVKTTGTNFNGTSSVTNFTGIALDGTTAETGISAVYSAAANVNLPSCVSCTKAGLAEGYHYATLLGYVNGGTGSWTGGGTTATCLLVNVGGMR